MKMIEYIIGGIAGSMLGRQDISVKVKNVYGSLIIAGVLALIFEIGYKQKQLTSELTEATTEKIVIGENDYNGDDLNDAHFIQKNCHKVPAIRVDNSDGSISYLGSEEYLTIQITQ